METKVLQPNKQSIALACKLLKQGEVVAVPTETVYGLAGDCTNSEAIKKIFIAKGRPNDNPLIVHIAKFSDVKRIVSKVPKDAKIIAKHFWPGPITIIMPKGKAVCNESCAGLDSVGVRMPSHPVAHEIILKSKVLFSAPSANLSGRPSPTTAQDVFVDMNGRVPLIIDGGESDAGVESTVVSTLSDTPVILRPGVITKEMLESVLHKKVVVASEVTKGVKKDSVVRSPGMKYKHYSPNAEVTLIKSSFKSFKTFVEGKADVYAMCFDGEKKKLNVPALEYGEKDKPEQQAHNLFAKLRELDKLGAKTVYVRCPNTTGVALAVYNRLIRSAGFKVIKL